MKRTRIENIGFPYGKFEENLTYNEFLDYINNKIKIICEDKDFRFNISEGLIHIVFEDEMTPQEEKDYNERKLNKLKYDKSQLDMLRTTYGENFQEILDKVK